MNLFPNEDRLRRMGITRIAGIDEAGVGCLAGPIVAAAVVLDLDAARTLSAPLQLKTKIKQVTINDSKQLKPAEREVLFPAIIQNALDYHVAFIYPSEINDIHNILHSGNTVRHRAAANVQADYYLCDHFTIEGLPISGEGITKGDTKSISIAAASILAKVTRDRYMTDLSYSFPGYGWSKNFGYYSEVHLDSIRKLGVTSHHRTYYKPIQEIIRTSV